jgi:hypothetical protein
MGMSKQDLLNMTIEDIKLLMLELLPVKTYEKNEFGEVFTPLELVEEMLDTLPKHIWSNPKLRWLEPCAGVGHFAICVYLRLMKGLESVYRDRVKRHNHILTSMLYMNELNGTNVAAIKRLFGAGVNVKKGDIFNYKCDDECFNIIVGNPPFQDEHLAGGKNKLYERITSFCVDELLKKDGLLLFLVPDNLFSGNSVVGYRKLLENHVKLVSFEDKINIFFPKIQQYICYFLLKRSTPSTTQIISQKGQKFETMLLDRVVNPVRNWTKRIDGLVKKYIGSEKNNAVYVRGKPISEYKGSKYKVIYTPDKKLGTNKSSLAVGHGIPKIVIFSISPDLKFETDFDGSYGCGPNTFYIPVPKGKGRLLEKFLKSDDYRTLALATKTTRQFLKIAFIQHLLLDKIYGSGLKTKKLTTTNVSKTRKNQDRLSYFG